MAFETVAWRNGKVVLLDQTRLPAETVYHEYDQPEQVISAIEMMIVRGAPAIGVTAALGLALAAQQLTTKSLQEARSQFLLWAERFARTRPTAVNLFWGIEKMKHKSMEQVHTTLQWASTLLEEALKIRHDDIEACRKIGEYGSSLVPQQARILTHCNAGALATAGWGTALGVIRSAVKNGKQVFVFVDETRPFLQGARLTTWELLQERIPATLITDNMAGHFLYKKEIDLVIVGADRIAANGDVANKIGTYSLAVLARENQVPFFVAAPLSTLDLSCSTGEHIPIEERNPKEVLEFAGHAVAPAQMPARHPAFDVTPAKYVSAIITESGIAYPPYDQSLAKISQPTFGTTCCKR